MMEQETGRKVWLITGASSGFGLAVARRVLAAGECAALTARDPGVLAELCAEYPDQARAFAMEHYDLVEYHLVYLSAEHLLIASIYEEAAHL